MDVITAFLNGTLKEEVYMEIPEGFTCANDPTKVCKINRALYEFRQSPKYINRLLDRFRMTNCNMSSLPMDPAVILTRETGTLATDPHEYRALVGSLIYLTNTRPDVCFAVSNVSRYMDKPQVAHLQAAKLILKYLKGTIDFGLHFPSQD
jgi:hypothetical protein